MSRIGKRPVIIPDGVTVTIENKKINVKGPKGELSFELKDFMKITLDESDKTIYVEPEKKNDKFQKSYWGMARKLIQNMVDGVSKGFEKKLIVEGVGYRAQVQGNKLVMNLGFSHPVEMDIPSDLKVTVTDNVNITVSGIDKYKVGQYAALIREKREPEPYKGKGIRYADEHIKLKVGKSGV